MLIRKLTKQECKWLADLVSRAKEVATRENEATPHPLLELRRDNMASLEAKLNAAVERENQKGRGGAR